MDTDHNGKVDFHEFYSLVKRFMPSEEADGSEPSSSAVASPRMLDDDARLAESTATLEAGTVLAEAEERMQQVR